MFYVSAYAIHSLTFGLFFAFKISVQGHSKASQEKALTLCCWHSTRSRPICPEGMTMMTVTVAEKMANGTREYQEISWSLKYHKMLVDTFYNSLYPHTSMSLDVSQNELPTGVCQFFPKKYWASLFFRSNLSIWVLIFQIEFTLLTQNQTTHFNPPKLHATYYKYGSNGVPSLFPG